MRLNDQRKLFKKEKSLQLNFPAFTKLHYVHVQTFVYSCPDFRAFFRDSRQCKFERTTPHSCGHFGLDISGFCLGGKNYRYLHRQ